MSLAKSLTECFVGILVRLGKLDILGPMGVKEWSVDNKRSRITIDQMLRMVDGSRFREGELLWNGSVRLVAFVCRRQPRYSP